MAFLSDLWVASWRETLPEIDFEARRTWLAEALLNPVCVTLVAVDGRGPVGFATTEGRYLHQLVVAPQAKGTGAATRLLDAVKARSGGRLALDVNEENPRAVRFYTREGFEIAGNGRNRWSQRPTLHMVWCAARDGVSCRGIASG